MLDVGSLMGSLVVQSEERTRKALTTIDAMAPCVLFIDEIDKALSGITGSGATDSGVSTGKPFFSSGDGILRVVGPSTSTSNIGR